MTGHTPSGYRAETKLVLPDADGWHRFPLAEPLRLIDTTW